MDQFLYLQITILAEMIYASIEMSSSVTTYFSSASYCAVCEYETLHLLASILIFKSCSSHSFLPFFFVTVEIDQVLKHVGDFDTFTILHSLSDKSFNYPHSVYIVYNVCTKTSH
jgi:hypothetical protein